MAETSKINFIQGRSIEWQVSSSPKIKEKLIEGIKDMMKKIPWAGNDLEKFFRSKFWTNFDQNDATKLLRLYSYCFIQSNNSWLNDYMSKIWVDINKDPKKKRKDPKKEEIFKIAFPNEPYRWTMEQNTELFHFLVRQVEIVKLIGWIQAIAETQTQVGELNKTIPANPDPKKDKTQDNPILPENRETKKGNSDAKEPEGPKLSITLPKENETGKQVDWLIKEVEDQTLKASIEEETTTLNWEIKKRIAEFWININDIKSEYEKLSWNVYDDLIEQNAWLYATLFIQKSWTSFNKYLRETWEDTTRENKAKLYRSFFPWRFMNYNWWREQNLAIYRSLVMQNEFWVTYWHLTEFQTQERTEKILGKYINPKKVSSLPAVTNPRTWSTLCSYTARNNLARLWVSWWDILQEPSAMMLTNKLKRSGAPTFSDPNALWEYMISRSNDWNVFDIFPRSNRWHRAIAFLWDWWEIYVLDPYYWGSTKPVTLKEYAGKYWYNFREYVVNPTVYQADSKFLV